MLYFLLFLRFLLPVDPVSTVPNEMKLRLVEQINHDREAEGLPRVVFSEELSRAADDHCREMLLENYMSHWNRAGWKPYLRYAAAGVREATQENVWGVWKTHFDKDESQLRNEMLRAHRSFMAEKPPLDGHRKSILGRRHTHVGIGVAYNDNGMRLIELFGARYAEMEPLPLRATLRDSLHVKGKMVSNAHELFAVSVFYEPLPTPMTPGQLKATYSYELPKEEEMQRLALRDGVYADGSLGSVMVDRFGRFTAPVRFWKRKPGVYTVVVWVREKGDREGFMGAMTSILVNENDRESAPTSPLRSPGAAGRLRSWPSGYLPGAISVPHRDD